MQGGWRGCRLVSSQQGQVKRAGTDRLRGGGGVHCQNTSQANQMGRGQAAATAATLHTYQHQQRRYCYPEGDSNPHSPQRLAELKSAASAISANPALVHGQRQVNSSAGA